MIVSSEIRSKYRMIVLAGKRVAQLQQGATPRVEGMSDQKPTRIAMAEIAAGKIGFSEIEEYADKQTLS
ncbi:MAG: DNA-directed RNA polymerase subunit omega [Acidobacteria bacterium]|nr:MAG: DNA-directed RNA polymerase subunit omega [Acidobacteriota bacterium]PIE91573.1 MAG: DNA-directed RNA polymerase subunit omega [Acidobacteriota bacterium]